MRYLFVVVTVLALTACVSSGQKVDQGKLAEFVKGKTTYDEVIQELGKPSRSTTDSEGSRTLTYSYMQIQGSALNYIPIVGPLIGGSEMESTTVFLHFDENSLLTDYTASEGGSSTGTGILSGRKQ